MLLKINTPSAAIFDSLLPSIEYEVAKRFRTRTLPFTKYLLSNQIQSLIHVAPENLKKTLINAPNLCGVELPDGCLLVHPDAVYKQVSKSFITLIKKEIKRKAI